VTASTCRRVSVARSNGKRPGVEKARDSGLLRRWRLKHAPTFELAYRRENDTSDYAALAALACPRFSEAAVDLEHLTRWKFMMVKNPGRDGTSSPLAQPVVLQTEKTQRVSIG
jgi:hypothetical protein